MNRMLAGLIVAMLFPYGMASAFTLSGTITNASGNPLAGIPVDVLRISPTSGNLVRLSAAGAVSDGSGNYTTADLAAGEYWLRVNNTTNDASGVEYPTRYEGLYYHPLGNRPDRDAATPIQVDAGTGDLPGFNFVLRPAFTVSGNVSVVAPLTTDFTLVDFDVYDAESGLFLPLLNTKANADGSYVLHGFPPGSFYLKCDPPAISGLYPVFQGNVFLERDAEPLVVLDASQSVVFTLAPGYTLSGTVRAGGVTQGELDMDLYRVNQGSFIFISDSTATDPAGLYVSSILPPGDYAVRADPPQQTTFLAIGYYTTNASPASLIEEATVVTLSNSVIESLDITLIAGGKFQGQIVGADNGIPLFDADVDIYSVSGVRAEADAKSDINGFFSTDNLLPGDYVVRADPPPGTRYVRRYAADTNHFEDATIMTIAANTTHTGLIFRLPLGGVIGGIITDRLGNPLAGIDLDVYEAASDRGMEANATSLQDGSYRLDALPEGTYIVRADPENGQPWVRQYFSNALSAAEASPVAVTGNSLMTNVNFMLDNGGFLSGYVTTTGGVPLAGYDIDIFDETGKFVPVDASTDASGFYLVGALTAGRYAVRSDGPEGAIFAQRYSGGGYFVEAAHFFDATPGTTNSDINIELETGGFLAGRLADTNLNPVVGADLDIFDDAGRRLEVGGLTDSVGGYVAGPLSPGHYTVRFQPRAADYLVTTYYPSGWFSEEAIPALITAGVTNYLDDVFPAFGGAISGVITDTNGTPLSGIDLDAYSVDGTRLEGNALSAADGRYVMGPFPFSNVIIRADPGAVDPYVRQYYTNAASQSAATPVAIFNGQTISNINFRISPGAMIYGRVVFSNQMPLSGLDMDVYPVDGGVALEQTALTGSDGAYQLGPVPEGRWAVRVNPSAAQGYETRYYPDTGNITSATPLQITGGQNLTNIDFEVSLNEPPVFSLAPFGGISNGLFSLNCGPSSDPNGDRLLYRWIQVGGPLLVVSNDGSSMIHFQVPADAPSGARITLKAYVEDFTLSSATQVVEIINGRPEISAISRIGDGLRLNWTLGSPPQPYKLEQSSNLENWSGIVTGNQFEVYMPVNGPIHFFRVNTMR